MSSRQERETPMIHLSVGQSRHMTFHRGEEKTDSSSGSARAVLVPLSSHRRLHYYIFYLCVHLLTLQSPQSSNLHDGPAGNARIFPHLLCVVCSALARGALEHKCYQTHSAMRKYESMLTRLDAVFLMTTIR